jgi:hypothetical protein
MNDKAVGRGLGGSEDDDRRGPIEEGEEADDEVEEQEQQELEHEDHSTINHCMCEDEGIEL